RRVHELRRVEDDDVELLAAVTQDAQLVEHVRGGNAYAVRDAVRGRRALRRGERIGGAVDEQRFARAREQARDAETAGVGECVEHACATRIFRDARAVEALVEVAARLLATGKVDGLAQRAELDLDRSRHLTAQRPAPRRQ